jgi:hypothetical protein
LGIARSTSIPNNIHITLALLAHAVLVVTRAQEKKREATTSASG